MLVNEASKFCNLLNEKNPYAMARVLKTYHTKNLSTLASLKLISVFRKNYHLERGITLAMKRSI